jgi:FkbH-like protein
MKLLEALEILKKSPREGANEFRVFLACSFTPLHLKTLLAAHLQLRLPAYRVQVETGIYGDLPGSLEKAAASKADAVVVAMEWQDIDPRLGLRSLGGWAPLQLPDILANAKSRAAQIAKLMEQICKEMTCALSLPSLPLPPIAYTPGWQSSEFESELSAVVSTFAAQLGRLANLKLLSGRRLDSLSPIDQRADVKSELLTGFPYRVSHADTFAELLARLIQPPAPKKGLITDLDNTLWSGILGEAGYEGVSWDLDHHSHMHGLYQQFLGALAGAGVLLGIASKNDLRFVEEVFANRETILKKDAIFPIEASWGAKSEAVGRILKAWNIGAGDVVFVDDSPMELAEVKAAHPAMECVRFPEDDPQGVYELIRSLRDLFGKSALREEDAFRLESLRAASSQQLDELTESDAEAFLESAESELTINFGNGALDPRALELVNKTNQFNLNGKRHTAPSLEKYLQDPQSFLMVVSYKDKFGPLGKIAVVAGRHHARKLWIDAWVMSCRAFSRRIEHRCFEELLSRFDSDEVEFDFVETPRNEPFRTFLVDTLGAVAGTPARVNPNDFSNKKVRTYHRVLEPANS